MVVIFDNIVHRKLFFDLCFNVWSARLLFTVTAGITVSVFYARDRRIVLYNSYYSCIDFLASDSWIVDKGQRMIYGATFWCWWPHMSASVRVADKAIQRLPRFENHYFHRFQHHGFCIIQLVETVFAS